jgi:hypothetical protein
MAPPEQKRRCCSTFGHVPAVIVTNGQTFIAAVLIAAQKLPMALLKFRLRLRPQVGKEFCGPE